MRSTLRRDASAVSMDAGRNVGVGVALINAALLLGVPQAAIAKTHVIKSNAKRIIRFRFIAYLPQRMSSS